MKPSPRVASFIILLFFLFFNGLQVYLVRERIAESKARYNSAGMSALMTTLFEYNKLKVMDSASVPDHAWIAYAPEKIEVRTDDTGSVQFSAPYSHIKVDTLDAALLETVMNSPAFRTIDLELFDSLFRKALAAKNVHAAYHLDTIITQGKKYDRNKVQMLWARKRNPEYLYSTFAVRLGPYSNYSVYAEYQSDPGFIKEDLLRPILSFALILLIGNAALVFVYTTIRKQKRINELKTDFINNITHEMKTPITIASAGLEALAHHVPANERTDFYLQTSKRQLRLLNEFVERIVDAAVRDVSDFTLKKEKIDVHALFAELIRTHTLMPGKQVNFRLTGEGPIYIQGDRLHLETAFHNMIDNAMKYSNGAVDIQIDLVQNNRDCTIRIRDNGRGIPQQYLKNIFDKFFRVPQGDAQSIKGFGLGLYYVNSIVKKHAGHIAVQSKQQSGTEFIITLPTNS